MKNVLSIQEWTDEAARLLVSEGGMDEHSARDYAKSLIESNYDDGMSPAEAVRSDMSYWD